MGVVCGMGFGRPKQGKVNVQANTRKGIIPALKQHKPIGL
jgi:hypothetical protein